MSIKKETYGNCEFRFEVTESSLKGILSLSQEMYLVTCICTKNGEFGTSFNVRFDQVIVTINYIRDIIKRKFTHEFATSVSEVMQELTQDGFVDRINN